MARVGDSDSVDEILGDFDTFKTELKVHRAKMSSIVSVSSVIQSVFGVVIFDLLFQVWETRVSELNDEVKAVSTEDLNPHLASTLREHLNDVNTR